MRIAVLADIHGNLRALRAVLDDLEDQSPDLVVNLGDCLSGPLDGAATADLLMSRGFPAVRGNHDRYLVSMGPEEFGPSDRITHKSLTQRHLDWLRGFPATMTVADEVLLCHGTLQSDEDYLLDDIQAGRLALASEASIIARLGSVQAGTRVVACGHSHYPRVARAGDCLVVNPGSVGLQAYLTDSPAPTHVSENGSPHARYALLDRQRSAWRVTFVAVEYDWVAASKDAASVGFDDWSARLASGYARRPSG
jgi:putative phosphoesterase